MNNMKGSGYEERIDKNTFPYACGFFYRNDYEFCRVQSSGVDTDYKKVRCLRS